MVWLDFNRAVYPRVGGGTGSAWRRRVRTDGLSPRGRGNHKVNASRIGGSRSIPAWAGEPGKGRAVGVGGQVYPRVGGGTALSLNGLNREKGLSPRGRGNPRGRSGCPGGVRSIPAWAGEPLRGVCPRHSETVYPRVGGGTTMLDGDYSIEEGLSPRGRGNRKGKSAKGSSGRSIPAWAGEPERQERQREQWKVYPRVGGGTWFTSLVVSSVRGLSPRGRGNRSTTKVKSCMRRSIPAWAGEPFWAQFAKSLRQVYPRVGGGTLFN